MSTCVNIPVGGIVVNSFDALKVYAEETAFTVANPSVLIAIGLIIIFLRYPFPYIGHVTNVLICYFFSIAASFIDLGGRFLSRELCADKRMFLQAGQAFGAMTNIAYYLAITNKSIKIQVPAPPLWYKYGAYVSFVIYFAFELWFRTTYETACTPNGLVGFALRYNADARLGRGVTQMFLNFYLIVPFVYKMANIIRMSGGGKKMEGLQNIVSLNMLTLFVQFILDLLIIIFTLQPTLTPSRNVTYLNNYRIVVNVK